MATNQTIAKRLSELRHLMRELPIDYYFVPTSDPHRNEYLPACWQRRSWISGFTGSAGDVLVGMDNAFLWTDPRYFLQAEQQLDPALFQLMKLGQAETPRIDQWLLQQNRPQVFACDPQLLTPNQADLFRKALEEKGGSLLFLEKNLIDQLWRDRPPLPKNPIQLHPLNLAGESAENKLIQLKQHLQAEHVEAIVFNALDTIAWLLNIRGNDIAYNPLVLSYLIVTEKKTTLFVDRDKITDEIESYFKKIHVNIESYEAFAQAVHSLSGRVWLDPTSSSEWIRSLLKNASLRLSTSPITLLKAIKNPIEQQGAREAHVLDAIAMIQFLHWLETHWQSGVTEITASQQLEAFRRKDKRCLDLSFSTISGFGPNGAIVHYSATPETDIPIDDSSLYLLDSGGQYRSGTTDITRTIHLGKPTEEQKQLYTLVLKGHLAIRHTSFPSGTTGERIDALAHQFLWKNGLDYGHGTGHGVGSYLCVHEGPQAISSRQTGIPLQAGMIVSNEPGVYIKNKYGIRIENLCLITEKFTRNESLTGDGPFYIFEDLTLVPYCRRLIDVGSLTDEEVQQINDYHHHLYQTLKDLLPTKELNDWLQKATEPLL